jgi:hypothetical protein
MIAVSKREEFEYVLIEDRDLPTSKQTVFVCRPLSLFAQNQVEDLIGTKATAEGFPAGTINCEILRHGLADWRNMHDENGKEVACMTAGGKVTDESLERLTTFQRTEIANSIWETVNITPGEAKNLNWPSQSPRNRSDDGPARTATTSKNAPSGVWKKPETKPTGSGSTTGRN